MNRICNVIETYQNSGHGFYFYYLLYISFSNKTFLIAALITISRPKSDCSSTKLLVSGD